MKSTIVCVSSEIGLLIAHLPYVGGLSTPVHSVRRRNPDTQPETIPEGQPR